MKSAVKFPTRCICLLDHFNNQIQRNLIKNEKKERICRFLLPKIIKLVEWLLHFLFLSMYLASGSNSALLLKYVLLFKR